MALSEVQRRPMLFDEAVPRPQLVGQAALFGVWSAVTVIGALLHPSSFGHGTHEQLGLPPCPSVMFFDRPCPGCGLTTSWTAFIHGDLAFSLHAHPLGPLLYLLFTGVALLGGYGFLTCRRLRTYCETFNRMSGVVAVTFICFGLIRFAAMPHFAAKFERQLYTVMRDR